MSDQRFALRIEGMHCGGCVRRVEKALADVPGVTIDEVGVGSAVGSFDPADTDLGELVMTIGRLGFAAEPTTDAA
jgi:copper chaperone